MHATCMYTYVHIFIIYNKSILFKTPLESNIKISGAIIQMYKQSSSLGESNQKYSSYMTRNNTNFYVWLDSSSTTTITCKMQIMYNNKINNMLLGVEIAKIHLNFIS